MQSWSWSSGAESPHNSWGWIFQHFPTAQDLWGYIFPARLAFPAAELPCNATSAGFTRQHSPRASLAAAGRTGATPNSGGIWGRHLTVSPAHV